MIISGHGLSVDVPDGWDARIYKRRLPKGEPGESFPIIHASNVALPVDPGDYGGGAVKTMGPGGMFVALLEFGPSYQRTPGFAPVAAVPSVRFEDFSPQTMQVFIPGGLGLQRFFVYAGRSFCCYAVAGSAAGLESSINEINGVLASLALS